MPIKTVAAATATAVVAAVALVASGSAVAAHHKHHASRKRGTLVELRKTKLGKVLTTSKGITLYLDTSDSKRKSACTSSCASIWPPLLTRGTPQAGKGLKKKLLRTTKRGGKLQVTYAGHRLYRYSGDTKAGQTKGEGYAGIWYLVNARGKKVAKKSSGTYGGGY